MPSLHSNFAGLGTSLRGDLFNEKGAAVPCVYGIFCFLSTSMLLVYLVQAGGLLMGLTAFEGFSFLSD